MAHRCIIDLLALVVVQVLGLTGCLGIKITPSDLSFSTINLNTTLHWAANKKNAFGVKYDVEYSLLRRLGEWKPICSNITETLCVINIDKEALSYGPTLAARVRAVSENAVSEWKYEETNPVDDGSIGPPAISLEAITAQSVSFRMELPKTPYVDSNNVVLLVDSSEFILKPITKEISISSNTFNRTNYTTNSWWIWEDLEENTSYNITSYSIYGKCPECSRSYTAGLVAVRTLSSEESSTSEPEITDLPNVLLAYIIAFVLALVLFLVVVRYLSRFLKRRVTIERFKFPVWWESVTTDNAYVCSHRSNEPPELFDPLKGTPPKDIPSKDECGELLKQKTDCKKAIQPQEEFEIDEYVTHAFIASLTLNFTSHQT